MDCLHQDAYYALGKYFHLVDIPQILRRDVLCTFSNFKLHAFSEFHYLPGAFCGPFHSPHLNTTSNDNSYLKKTICLEM